MQERYAAAPYSFSGTAARWNPKGTNMIYAASSPALAQLEYLCIRGHVVGTQAWRMIIYEIRDETLVGEINPAHLPADWNALPHSLATQEIGKQWLTSSDAPFLKVPSARLHLQFFPDNFNLLVNPDFPDIRDLFAVVNTVPFSYVLNA
ncbi:MAG TPA: RES family NAD+ phosphorylase [Chryseolinea sp.]